MKIIRNGIEYELTTNELRMAYDEWRSNILVSDIKSNSEVILEELDIDSVKRRAEYYISRDDALWECY